MVIFYTYNHFVIWIIRPLSKNSDSQGWEKQNIRNSFLPILYGAVIFFQSREKILIKHFPYSLLFLILFLLTTTCAQGSAFEEEVKRIISDDGEQVGKTLGGQKIYGKYFILRMYVANGYKPLWRPKAIQSLSRALDSLALDGLNPAEYRFPNAEPFLKSPNRSRYTLAESAKIDILLTEAYLRGLYHLYYGKSDPQGVDPNNNFGQARDGKDRSNMLLSWAKKGQIDEAYDWARPKNQRYRLLKAGLAHYRRLQAAGGWSQIPKGGILKPGDSDSRVSLIRKRLAITGDVASADGSNTYDSGLEKAIKSFQDRHGLDADGIIGPTTLANMNIPVKQRIDQIRVNLERQRWMLHEDYGEFLAVDIAGFMIYWSKDGQIIWHEQVQIGKKYTNTPIFKDEIRYLVLNPTWTIPPGIMRRTILPNLKKDPGYLNSNGYQLLTRNGQRVDPYSVDWNAKSSVPYMVRQPSGKDNALGLVKFMFPNKHHVFLHDTNHRELFARQVRTTSSGCIRLRNPFDLAERLLAGQGWSRARIDKVVRSGKTTRVNLEKPMRILIFYSTAWSEIDGKVRFKQDIYKRDPKVLKALNGPFRFHKKDLKVMKNTLEIAEPESEAFDNGSFPLFLEY